MQAFNIQFSTLPNITPQRRRLRPSSSSPTRCTRSLIEGECGACWRTVWWKFLIFEPHSGCAHTTRLGRTTALKGMTAQGQMLPFGRGGNNRLTGRV